VLPHVHVLPGLRFEQFVWDVDDLDPETQADPSMTSGGSAGRAMLLPKLSVEIEASDKLNLFANAGTGFHSNDARSNAANGGSGALARALGAEVGVRTTLVPHARISADVWYLHLDSELVWSGDAGSTEASDSTRRYGCRHRGGVQSNAVAPPRRHARARALDARPERRQTATASRSRPGSSATAA